MPRAFPRRETGTPAYRWLYECLRADVLAGRLRPGTRLPGSRDLASEHGLSRGTVVAAFDLLAAEGYVEGAVGSGTYVSRVLPEDLLEAGRGRAERPAPERLRRARPLAPAARRSRRFPGFDERPAQAFRLHLPALDQFPTALWAHCAARRWRAASARQLTGCDVEGYRPLRRAVADYLAAARGVRADWSRVLIVSGAQEALDLTLRVLVAPGERVVIEDPGYSGAAWAVEAAGARLVPAPVDADGLVVSDRVLRGARLVYTTPAHQFPTGATMTLARRLALLDGAHRSGAVVFEDDYDSEFRYSGRPVPALQGLDDRGSVIFAGSFNKVLFPSLRLGYLVVPEDLVEPFSAVKSLASRHAPLMEQAILCDWIEGGHFGRHLRRMRGIYAERLGALISEATARLSGHFEICPVEAGLQTSARILGSATGEAIERAAADRAVEVVSFHHSARAHLPYQGLQLGFAAIDPREIRRGVEALARALDDLEKAKRSGRERAGADSERRVRSPTSRD